MKISRRGSVSAFVVCLIGACVPCLALVVDGGRLAIAHTELADQCQNAARLAAQNVVGIREGNPRVDTRTGVSDARRFMDELGINATVTVDGSLVRVTAVRSVRLPMMSLLGIGTKQVRVTRAALLTEG